MGERAKRARENFMKGCNCSQSVFLAFADLYGFDEATAMRISASFGAGMGRMREICGCFSGVLLVAGMETGATAPADQKAKGENYRQVQELAARFKEENGSIVCRELLAMAGYVPKDASWKPQERNGEYYRKRPCPDIVERAAQILEETFFSDQAESGTSEGTGEEQQEKGGQRLPEE